MAGSYRAYEPDQMMLLRAAPQDWLPAGHLAHFISDTVDALDLKAFYARYEGGGSRNQPFHPATMVKVLVYAYATDVFSSRKIERRLHENLAVRMLAATTFRGTARFATSGTSIRRSCKSCLYKWSDWPAGWASASSPGTAMVMRIANPSHARNHLALLRIQ